MKELPLHQFFLENLYNMKWVESHVAEALAAMGSMALSERLHAAVHEYIEKSLERASRLGEAIALLRKTPLEIKCMAVPVMINETLANLSHGSYPAQIRDLVVIMGLQRITAYQIASYKTLLAFSRSMGHLQTSQVLTENIDGETASAEALMDIVVHSTIPLALKEPA